MPPRNTRLKVSAPGAGVRFKSMASRGWEPSQNTLTYLIAGDAAAVASAMGARPSTGTISQGCPGAAVASVGGILSSKLRNFAGGARELTGVEWNHRVPFSQRPTCQIGREN